MKKIVIVSLTLLLSATMLSPIVSLAESNSSVETSESEQDSTNNVDVTLELEKFSDMQDDITSVLKVESGKYVYDANEVKAIVDEFDFDTLAEKTGIEFTNESFFEDAITNIENTTLKSQIQSRNANRYNRNYYEEGWNYQIIWWDEANTNKKIIEFEDVQQYAELAGGVGGTLGTAVTGLLTGPIGAGIAVSISFGVFYDGWYFGNVALNLNRIKNGTGTVMDRNKLTTVYSLWTQDKYKK